MKQLKEEGFVRDDGTIDKAKIRELQRAGLNGEE
jgi:hypothetical protein